VSAEGDEDIAPRSKPNPKQDVFAGGAPSHSSSLFWNPSPQRAGVQSGRHVAAGDVAFGSVQPAAAIAAPQSQPSPGSITPLPQV